MKNFKETLKNEEMNFLIKYKGKDKKNRTFSLEGLDVFRESINIWILEKIKQKLLNGFKKDKPIHKLNIKVSFKK